MPVIVARALGAQRSFARAVPFPAMRLPALLAVLAAVLLAGCAPSHDWREIRADEDRYLALMPDRPDHMTRPINLDGLSVDMSMQGARVDGVAFIVGAVVLRDASVAAREHALAAMRTAMVRNIRGRETLAEAVAVPVLDAAGQPAGSAPGWRIEAAGRAGDQPVSMSAVFAAHSGRAWQAVVVGPGASAEHAATFLHGFRILD